MPAFRENRLFLGFEQLLAHAADGADEILGQILEGGAGLDARVGIALGGIIHIAADGAHIFFNKRTAPCFEILPGRGYLSRGKR